MFRAVLDANVFVSALIRPEGPPGKILRHLFEKRDFELISSLAIMAELKRCIFYKKVRKYIRSSDQNIELWLASLRLLMVQSDGNGPAEPRLKDLGDANYLFAGYHGRASHIVSGDKHLLELKEYENIEILDPAHFLKALAHR